MKRFIILFLTVLMIITLMSCQVKGAKKEVFFIECDGVFYTYQNKDDLLPIINEQLKVMDTSHLMAESARALGYEEGHDIILIAQQEYKNAEKIYRKYLGVYNQIVEEYNLRWAKRKEEYPNASYIWLYLQAQGYNEYVCAGILGNMMTESGGQSFKIQPDIKDSTNNFYGICQWNKKYYPTVWDASLESQCEFLINNIESEFAVFGKNYKKDFSFQDFLKIENEREAAKCFALVYERCGKQGYRKRQDNAEKAYSYFAD